MTDDLADDEHPVEESPEPKSAPDVAPNLLVSIHVAKTGGNTFATILERAATGMYGQIYGPEHPQTGVRLEGVAITPLDGTTHDLNLFDRLLAVPSIGTRRNVLHGHLNAGKMRERFPDAEFLVWLRDPVDRVMSHYTFWKRLEVEFDDPLYRRFRDEDMTVEEFAAEPRIRDTQTRTTGRRPVEDFAFVGITEQYDRSLDLFGRMFAVDTSDIVPRNFNPKQTRSHYELPEETRTAIEAHNQQDLELYRAGVARLDALDAATPRPSKLRRGLGSARRRVRNRLERGPDGD